MEELGLRGYNRCVGAGPDRNLEDSNMAGRYFKDITAVIVALSIATTAFAQAPAKKKPIVQPAKPAASEATSLTERQRAIHALNRLTFGPRPRDIDAVLAKGVDAWIEDQLHPESIDDSGLNTRVAE
jgi:hypothetical protein